MGETRANMIKARGLVTYGSELALPEGSQRQATNVNIDEDGVITPRRGFNDYSGATTGSVDVTATVNQIMEYKKAILRQYKDEFLEYEDTNGDFQAVTGSYRVLREGYRTKWKQSNSNLYFTTDEGIKKISETSRANLNANMVKSAGGIKAGYASGVVVPTVGGFLLPQSKTAYRVIFGTKDNNNNLILGAPSSRFVVTNFNADVNIPESVSIDIIDYASIVNDDYFTYTNSTGKYVIYFDNNGSSVSPKTSETIGGIYIKVSIAGLGSDETVAAVVANSMSVIPNSTITLSTSVVTVVSTEEGDITGITTSKASDGATSVEARIDTSVNTAGSINSGDAANVKVTGVVPSTVTTDYFYQVYRSSIITVTTGTDISDIDPGDELNLVYESSVTPTEISNGEFEFTDTTPESYRAEALALYTNEVSGEGLLQANEVPPIALDIELFRNYMFYANTKEKHRLEFTMISVNDFITSSTRLVIGNSDISRFYTFVGTAEVTDLTVASTPANGDYFNLYSANDERQYYIWFGTTDPEILGAVGINIADTSGTTSDIATRIETALSTNVDVSLSVVSNVITFTHTNNGYTTGIKPFDTYAGTTIYAVGDQVAFGGFNYHCILVTTGVDDTSEDPSGAATDNTYWRHVPITISTPSTDGTGELSGTDEGGDVLLSGLVSVGQSIDETARSLAKVISKDSASPVNAYYISTTDALPGNILLEAKSLEDKTFYIAIEESGNTAIGGEFSPELPYSKELVDYTGTGTLTNIELTTHGYVTGDEVFVGVREDDYDNAVAYIISDTVNYLGNIYQNILGSTGSAPSGDDTDNTNWKYISIQFSNVYPVTRIDDDNFSIVVATPASTINFAPTFSTTFSPDEKSDNKELVNRIYYSKVSEPEAVPVVNYIDVGTRNSEIRRILALRDNLFVLKDDGIYVVSGTSAPSWSTRLIDSTKIIAPDSAVVLNNQIYCLTEQGITRITGSGAAIISRGIEDKIDSITNRGFDFSSNTFGIAYEKDRAYIMFAPEDSSDTSSVQAFRYNIFEQTWSIWKYSATSGHVLSRDNVLYLGNADRNYISKERKNNNRTDHSDRNFSATINTNGIKDDVIQLSTITNVSVNDVIVQEQEVTINYVNNRLLKKMDYFDTGITLGASGGVTSYPTTSIVNFYTPYPHRLLDGSTWSIRITSSDSSVTTQDYIVTKVDDNNVTIEFDSNLVTITAATFIDYYYTTFKAVVGDNMVSIMQEINEHLFALDSSNITAKTYTIGTLRAYTETFVDELNTVATITLIKSYKKPITVSYEVYILSKDVLKNQVIVDSNRPFIEGAIEVYKGYTCTIEWNPQHFGDPSALKQIRYVTIMFDQNNFNIATAKFSSDAAQAVTIVPFNGKGIAYWGDLPWADPNSYWGGVGNDIPFRNPVPRGKQKCRYLSITFEHKNAREYFRILGISGVVRAISDRGYR